MTHPDIVPREKLSFGFDHEVPKYWLGGDPFKTRFCDSMSTIFPEGERYFISCVRDFRDQITDPKLLADVKDFMRQEGQHGIVHSQYNHRMRAMYAWHAMEEMEHKAVAFDVLQKVAKAGYLRRPFALVMVTFLF